MSENIQSESKGRGGARVGAGRKAGSATKKTREIADKAAGQGITPLEVMLDNMRFAHSEASGILAQLLSNVSDPADLPAKFDALKAVMGYRGMAQEAAKDAAPYLHPRLNAIEHTGKGGGAIETKNEWVVKLVRADPS
jgi:hypothetical protein